MKRERFVINEKMNLLLNAQKVKKIYESMLKDFMRQHNLTKNEIDILLFLGNNPEFDTAKEIVEIRALSKSQVCMSVDSLIKRGYLMGEQDKKDRRCIHLKLLPVVLPLVEEAKKIQEKLFFLLYQNVTEEEFEIMEQILKKISENIEGVKNHDS